MEPKKQMETNDFDWSVVEGTNTQFADVYPTILWIHGDKKAKEGVMNRGGFFLPASQYADLEADGWTSDALIPADGEDKPGYHAPKLSLAIIRTKEAWRTAEGGKKELAYKALVAIKGLDGLFQLSLPSPSKGLEFKDVLQSHMKQNLTLANRSRPAGRNPMEPFALWCPVESGDYRPVTSKDGKSSSVVTPPTLSTPSKVDLDYVRSLWVGPDNYKMFAQFYRDTERWQNEPLFRKSDAHDEDGLVTQDQIWQLINLAEAKGVDLKEETARMTNGESDRTETLTQKEAKILIEDLKAL